MWNHLAVLCYVGGGGASGCWEGVAFAAALRAVFNSSFVSLPHPRLPLWPSPALSLLSGQL